MSVPRKSVQTVLIVDDESEVRVMAARILSQQGCCVLTAESADDAYKIIKRSTPDVVLLDAHLKQLDIPEFHEFMIETKSGAKLFLTSRSRRRIPDGVGLISKPIRKSALVKAITATQKV